MNDASQLAATPTAPGVLPPPPTNVNGLTVSQANKLTPGSPIFVRDLVAVLNQQATVQAITPGQSLTVKLTVTGQTITYPLNGEGTVILPIFSLA